MYNFKPGKAFDLFNEGLTIAFGGTSESAAKLFEKSIAENPSNPAAYMYLIMMYEFMHEQNDILKDLCSKWVEVATKSGNEKQIARATASLKYYSATEDERKAMVKAFAKQISGLGYG